MSHTPGPWIATGFKNTVVNDSQGNTIALHPSHDGSVENAIANARLIAAAPDLLECAMALAVVIAENRVVESERSQLLEMCRAAIAKATGVQQ